MMVSQEILSLLLVALALSNAIPQAEAGGVWNGWGGNILNNRWAESNKEVSASSIQQLTRHCRVDFTSGVSAPPALWDSVAYFPTWNGLFVAYDYTKCKTKWQTNITAILHSYATPNAFQANSSIVFAGSRTSPQIDCKASAIYIGTQLYALLLALDLNTGTLLGHVQVNPHPLAVVTMSPTLYSGKIFVGTSSQEETAAVCTLRLVISWDIVR